MEGDRASVIIQEWDFIPGSNFVVEMDRAASRAERTLAVISPDYLRSSFGTAEWAAAFAKDAEGLERQLLPVRVRQCQLTGLLRTIVHIDLVGLSETDALKKLLDGAKGKRAKPSQTPPFPGSNKSMHFDPPRFPGFN
jgi:TIR domain-containing protein